MDGVPAGVHVVADASDHLFGLLVRGTALDVAYVGVVVRDVRPPGLERLGLLDVLLADGAVLVGGFKRQATEGLVHYPSG